LSAAGEDLNAWMVAEGQALAYRQYATDYVPQEERAKETKGGIWKEEFIFPWDWRRQNSQNDDNRRPLPPSFKNEPSSASNCTISIKMASAFITCPVATFTAERSSTT
jgi:hypothetical protein